jgi:molybdopterin-containing oxidoreductase family iron-sulfur binding subunit
MELLAAAATVGSCRRAIRQPIVPYVRRLPELQPDAPTTYATSMVLDGYATGLLVDCRDGRPIKIEGNPDHPASLGAAGPMEQASVLQLYDPDRARNLTLRDLPASWTGLRRALADLRKTGGDGLRVLMPPTSSPLLAELMGRVEQTYPGVRWAFHSPAQAGQRSAALRTLYGQDLELLYDFSAARMVVSLDSDFLARGPFSLRYARQWATHRDPEAGDMSRLYCAETMPSVTGSMAEHRLPIPPSQVARVGLQLAAEVVAAMPQAALPPAQAAALAQWRTHDQPWIHAAARDLAAAQGRGLVVVGDRQPAGLHILAHVLNRVLGNLGRTVWTIPSALVVPKHQMDATELVAEMRKKKTRTLMVLGGNPSFDTPVDLEWGRLMRDVPTSVYLGAYENETKRDSQWFVPEAHFLESWGDACAFDGTVSPIQPMLPPLQGGRVSAELMAALLEPEPPSLLRLLRSSWQRRHGGLGFETFWEATLKNGVQADSASSPVHGLPDEDAITRALSHLWPREGLEINFLPDPAVHDGRFANNAWLLEFPRPLSRMCWGNAAFMGPGMAHDLGVQTGREVELNLAGRSLRAPAYVMNGHAEKAVTLHLGFGREGTGERLAHGVGANAYAIRTSSQLHFGTGLKVQRTRQQHTLALAQMEDRTHDRPIALHASLPWYRHNKQSFERHRGPQSSLIPPFEYVGEQWVMSIDLGLCTGCGACVVACQAENNVPVVGAEEVRKGRLMHWLRVDVYQEEGVGGPRLIHQPLPCQHCERAPCEYVCPVNATVHSPDGLNEMVYNRCVGTRFCSNNCPYKVRRFNWFNWYDREEANQGSVRMQRNPEVTVRQRGVMEKCTYCVQRIRRAQIHARIQDRALAPGEVRTACQQACPTGAIAFASLAHTEEAAVKRRGQPRAYELLHDQGTKPRTWYLARIDNPNPELTRE